MRDLSTAPCHIAPKQEDYLKDSINRAAVAYTITALAGDLITKFPTADSEEFLLAKSARP